MFGLGKFLEILLSYKKNIKSRKNELLYKFSAVQNFQEKWDINANDFGAMLRDALSKARGLLEYNRKFSVGVILDLVKHYPEDIKKMFIELFDENKDLGERVGTFKEKAAFFAEKMYNSKDLKSYQDEHVITSYLWLMYPEKYYAYRHGKIKYFARIIGGDYVFKNADYKKNLINYLKLYNEITPVLIRDNELRKLIESLNIDCKYTDPNYHAVLMDIVYYSFDSLTDDSTNEDDEYYTDYSPNISKEEWLELLSNGSIFTKSSLEIMKRLLDFGGEATCTQLSEKYGEEVNFYNAGSTALAKRVEKENDCNVIIEDGKTVYWPILYHGKYVDKDEKGVFKWRLRNELKEALELVDLDGIDLYANNDKKEKTNMNYWLLVANPNIWEMTTMQVGEIQSYTFYSENNNKRHVFQNFVDAKVGDLVIGYESTPIKQIVSLMRVCKKIEGKEIFFENIEGLSNPINYLDFKKYDELKNMEFLSGIYGSLFKLTEDEYNFLIDLIRDSNPIKDKTIINKYTKKDFLKEVFISEEKYNQMKSVLEKKKNIILQGAPGVGKTFAAKRLAYSIMGEKDDSRVELVLFHQNYSYEDFVIGYRPTENEFELKNGVFYRFCEIARKDKDREYYFIIDEINRGNLSKIFGELLMLIEADYRNKEIILPYGDRRFSVPDNVYIIGMMNTADRSLAMIDYALRRRFSFIDMQPAFDSNMFKEYMNELNNPKFNKLINCIKELNVAIAKDRSLGKGFCIGHSYFCNCKKCSDEWIKEVIEFDIMPMLSEYWFDEEKKVIEWKERLEGILK